MRLALLTEKAACGVPEMPSNEIQQALNRLFPMPPLSFSRDFISMGSEIWIFQ